MCVLLFNSRAVWRARTEFVSRFMFSFQVRTQSCSVRVYFVSLSYAFVLSSYPSRVLFMWVWRLRVNFVSSRAVFVFLSYSFHVVSCSVRFALVFHFCGVWKVRVKFVSSRAVVVFILYTFQAVSCSVRNRLCFIYVGCEKLVSNSYPVVRVRVSFVSVWCGFVFKVVSCFCFIWCEVRKSRVKFVSTHAVFSCSVHIPLVYHLCGVWKVRDKVVSSRVHSCLFRIIHLCFRECFRVQFVFLRIFRVCLIHVWSGSLFWIRVALCLHIRFKLVFSRSSSHIIRKHSAREFQFNLYPVACRVNFVSCSYGFVFSSSVSSCVYFMCG